MASKNAASDDIFFSILLMAIAIIGADSPLFQWHNLFYVFLFLIGLAWFVLRMYHIINIAIESDE